MSDVVVTPDLEEDQFAQFEQKEAAEAAERERGQRLGALGARLDRQFQEQVAAKVHLEQRWIEDGAQYDGKYDADTLKRIRALGGSEAFVNLTRVKCNAVEAREGEMVIPTSDRNWSIEPTPEVELDITDHGDVHEEEDPDIRAQRMAEARKRCDAMTTVMDDQLTEADFNATQRSVIHNKVVLGTGILKGPVLNARTKRQFKKTAIKDAVSGLMVETWAETVVEDLEPGVVSVSPWDFFPDMAAVNMDDCEFTYERHRMNKQRLAALKKLPGFMASQVDAAIAAGPAATMSGLIDQAMADELRARRVGSRYEVLEFHGPITREELELCGAKIPASKSDQDDFHGVVWVCNGFVLKAAIAMMDGDDPMYDVVPYERDDNCIFGYSLPYRMRHSQSAGNAAWRMILDNGRASVGPQVVIRAGKVKPKDGSHRWTPFKVWEVTDPQARIEDVFGVFHSDANFKSMFDILNTVREFGDEETGMPQIAQGQQAPSITKTAEGMGILMNSANVMLRRLVKEYDDWITSRFIRRLYRWNMRFNEREDIKGDYTVKALGSAALLLVEQQSKGLMQLAQLAATNPEFSQRTKWGDLYRSIVKGMRINAESLVLSEKEYETDQQRRAQSQQMPPELQVQMAKIQVEQAKLQLAAQQQQIDAEFRQAELQLQAQRESAQDEIERARVQAAMAEAQSRREQAMASAQASYHRDQLNYQVAVLRLVQERQITMQQAQQQYGLKAMEIDSRHQLFNAEMAHANAYGQGI